MRQTRHQLSIGKRHTLEIRIRDIYASALISHASSQHITDERTRLIYQSKEYTRISAYDRAYLAGYEQAIYTTWAQKHIIAGYEWQGTIYYVPCWDQFPGECKQAIRDNHGPECKLYYKDTAYVW